MTRLLFFAKCPMNYVLFRPVHAALAQDDRFEFSFTGKLQGRGDPALVYRGFDLRGGRLVKNAIARWKKFDLYVTPDLRVTGKRARVKVHMFHGFSIRNFAIQERVREFDKLFLLGPYMLRRFVETKILAEGDPRIEMVGMPKLDALVNGAFDRARVLAGLGLDPAKKTVLFAPTWIEGGCLDRHGKEIVTALRALDVNVIVKLHDNSFDLRKQSTDWARVLPPLLGKNQVLARDPDSNPCLAAADLLISDASSVANEFLLLDRPLVFFSLAHLEKDWPATDRETWGTKTGAVIERVDQLERAVQDGLANPRERSDVRRAAAADFFHRPGTATARAVECLRRYAELPERVA